MIIKLCRTLGLAAGAFCLLSFGANAADDMMEVEKTFSKMHEAIAAAAVCGGRSFSRDDYQKMSAVIDKAVNYQLGAGQRLALIQAAKAKVRGETMTNSANAKNCDGDHIQNSLIVFKSNLEPAL